MVGNEPITSIFDSWNNKFIHVAASVENNDNWKSNAYHLLGNVIPRETVQVDMSS